MWQRRHFESSEAEEEVCKRAETSAKKKNTKNRVGRQITAQVSLR
jgi:hypothetical protein